MTCCFASRIGVEGYDEMLEHQAVMWPHESCATPPCWDASINLANSSHFDMDASRSFAVWLRTGPGTTRGWYLCFPAHGVALQQMPSMFCGISRCFLIEFNVFLK